MDPAMAATATTGFAHSRNRILIASADASFRKRVLRDPIYAGALSEEAFGGAHALAKLLRFPCDSVLIDRNLPDLDAQEVADQIRQQFPCIEVELLDSTAASAEAQDSEVREDNIAAPDQSGAMRLDPPGKFAFAEDNVSALPGMIGSSQAMQRVYALVRMVASRGTTVLVTGETGTGKELVAEATHQLSRRARHPFVVVNCAAIPEALMEAELFGYARGAFTGAVQSRLGRIHVAQGGTLFLDEVGELPLSMQAKLLRFLQNGEVQRLGSPDVYQVDVRVVCATNVRLLELVQRKQFRLDLYYRLAIFPIAVPPLRERPEDICALAEHFLEKLSLEAGMPLKHLVGQALPLLQKSLWAGNVRELQHAMERAFILAGNDLRLGVEHFRAFGESIELREI
jgi:transcriptional regulator with GAF, ATPase, and Fis domain